MKRRKAIKCKLVEKSSNDGYFKYLVTIEEKDGTIHKQPAYGKDMQSALSRLINKERTVLVERKLNSGWFVIAWLAFMTWPMAILGVGETPLTILLTFAGIGLAVGLGAVWYKYINRGI